MTLTHLRAAHEQNPNPSVLLAAMSTSEEARARGNELYKAGNINGGMCRSAFNTTLVDL